jgi:hypothetical protein
MLLKYSSIKLNDNNIYAKFLPIFGEDFVPPRGQNHLVEKTLVLEFII